MTIRTVAELKTFFESADQPTQQQFFDWLESFLHAGLANFPDPLPAVSGENLTNLDNALPDPLPARDGSQLTNINPAEYNTPPGLPVPSYATANSFVLPGDWTGTFLVNRRLELTIAGNPFYTGVQNVAVLTGVTTVTTDDAMPSNQLTAAKVGVIRPTAAGGAVSPKSIGATAIGVALLLAASAAAARTALGATAIGDALLIAASAAAARTALGATAIGDALLIAASAAAARTVIGAPAETQAVMDGDTAAGDLAGTYPNPTLKNTGPGATGPIGNGTTIPAVTIDAQGRVTALGSAAVAFSEIGVGQTWQDVTGSRASGTVYQNTTGKPIEVKALSDQRSSTLEQGSANLYIESANPPTLLIDRDYISINGGAQLKVGGIVPPGHYYKVVIDGTFSLNSWKELR